MDYIMRKFVKDYDNISDINVRSKIGKVSGIVGIITNILLAVIKLIAGLLAKSVALIADSVNNMSDSATSIVVLVGFKLAEKPADEEHPFGHARIEYISGIMISVIVIFLGFQLGSTSVQQIINAEAVEYTALTIAVLIISIIIKIWQSLFYRSVGKKIKSQTLLATSKDSRNDIIATSVVLIGTIITKLTSLNLDGFMGLGVAIFVTISGIKLVMETSDPLLGKAPDKELAEEIRSKALSYPGVLGIHDLTMHNYGAGCVFATLHCEVSADEDVIETHEMIDKMERDFLESMGIQMIIHHDPVVLSDENINALKRNIVDSVHEVYTDAKIHDFRVNGDEHTRNIYFEVAVPFSYQESDEQIREYITDIVIKIEPNANLRIVIDRYSRTSINIIDE